MKTSRLTLAILALTAACASPPPPETIADASVAGSPDGPQGLDAAAPDARPDAMPGTADLAISGDGAFGAIDLNAKATRTFTLTNHGDGASAALAAVAPGAPFVLGQDGCSGMLLAAGATCTFDVVFQPGQPGDASDTLEVDVGGVAQPSLAESLTGHGNSPATLELDPAATTDVGNVQVGNTASATLTIANTGDDATGPLAITPGDPAFAISGIPARAAGTRSRRTRAARSASCSSRRSPAWR